MAVHDTPDFSAFIAEFNYGEINDKITQKLAELVQAVEDVGKSGTLTLKLTIKKDNAVALVGVEVSAKVPEHPLNGSMFFFGENGSLLREDPRQLKLKNIDKPPAKLKTVAFPTASGKPTETGETDGNED